MSSVLDSQPTYGPAGLHFHCLRRQVLHFINSPQRALRPKSIWPSHSVGPCLTQTRITSCQVHVKSMSCPCHVHVMSMSCQLMIPKIIPAVTCVCFKHSGHDFILSSDMSCQLMISSFMMRSDMSSYNSSHVNF